LSQKIIGYADEQRRRDQRRAVKDTYVVIDGAACKVINMSLRSFYCVGYKGPAKEGDEIVVEDFLMSDDSRATVNATAKVVRTNAMRKEMAATFVDIDEKTFNLLEKMMMLRPTTEGGGGRLE